MSLIYDKKDFIYVVVEKDTTIYYDKLPNKQPKPASIPVIVSNKNNIPRVVHYRPVQKKNVFDSEPVPMPKPMPKFVPKLVEKKLKPGIYSKQYYSGRLGWGELSDDDE